jgi:hypothetical protein
MRTAIPSNILPQDVHSENTGSVLNPWYIFLVVLVLIFPHLICPSVLGSAVAVERIFSGGRDTISMWRASLQLETIQMLMVLKQCLRLVHTAINKAAAM